jgi:hypothetical protein
LTAIHDTDRRVTHIRISRAQHRCYVLGLPSAARLAQALAAGRAGRRVAATVAAVLAGVSLLASALLAVSVLFAGWLGAHHGDIHPLVWPALVAAAVATLAGGASELPNLQPDDMDVT